jgi:hypothetical protein
MSDPARTELDDLARTLAEAFRDLATDPERVLADVAQHYAEDVSFRDPIQTLEGRDAFVAMNRKLVATTRLEIRVDAWGTGPSAIFLAWEMRVTPKRGPTLVVPGTSHLTLRAGRVVSHVDHWDLLGATMDAIPFAGAAYRAAVKHLG